MHIKKVSLGRWRGTHVAIKSFYLHSSSSIDEWIREVQVLHRLRHKNLVQLYTVLRDPPAIVTDFMNRGSLMACLADPSVELSEYRKLRIALDVACAMDYLHQEGITHRDLKSLNIFLCKDWTAKVELGWPVFKMKR